MEEKPAVFNYRKYQDAVRRVAELEAENAELKLKNNVLNRRITELLEEKIAVQPITCAVTETDGINFHTVVKYKCQHCGAFIRRTFSTKDDYCGRCGKRIDWGL